MLDLVLMTKEMSITNDGPQICVMFYAKNKVCFCG